MTGIAEGAAVVTALSQAKPVLWDPLLKIFVSPKDVKEILDALNEAVEVIQSARKDYENKVEAHKTKEPSESYKQWIRRVEEIENQVEKLAAKYDKERKKSFRFFSSRSALIRQMQKTSAQAGNLLEAGNQLKDKLFADPKLEPVVKIGAPEIVEFETLQEHFKQILDLLKNDKVNGIGICGPLGIGKTTIMKNLNNHDEVAKMFDVVIWVKVSTEGSKKNLSREHLQKNIARRLKISMEGNNNADEVAQKISMVLKGTKYLLLLDDVKEDLDLCQMGIGDRSNGSKFVSTTRMHHVCSSKVDRMIKVRYLSPDEAWKMFQSVLQNPNLINNQYIGPLAFSLCNECSGLPLLIEKVANTFKLKNSEHVWIDGLNSWRKWPEKDCEGIWEIYKLLKFCYDDLDDDQRKKCFLYGALYPEDSEINIDCLLECWAAEDFLGNYRDARKDRLMKGHLTLTHLKNVSLLEESKTENHVIMHKFIRQMALHISENHSKCKYLVETSRELQKPPHVKSWPEKNRISLGDNQLDQLPDSPKCRTLSTLFLQKNLGLKIIPESFFKYMENLRVLDLSHTGITFLPSSLSILIGLKVLYLIDCEHLKELSSHILNLVNLESLDIRGSGVKNIPPDIEKLICLRRLLVSFTKSGNGNGNGNATEEVRFDYKMISKLSILEELVVDVKSPEQWSNEVVENIIKEVATLQNLKTLKFCFSNKVVNVIEVMPTTLRIRVPEASILQSFIKRKNVQSIKSFEFFIGCQNSEHPQIPNFVTRKKYVKYCNGAGSNFLIPDVLADADAFELVNHKDIKQIPNLVIASMNKVQGCLIENCDAIETIIGPVDSALLTKLEHLYIKNLPKLETIWKGPPQPGSLTKLTTLVLTRCKRLVEIFPPGVIQQLCEIQYLKIEECQGIEEIVSESDAVGNLPVLPKLKELILLEMSKLRSICAVGSLEWPSLRQVNIFKCPNLHELPFNEGNAAKLVLMEAEQHWWKELQWQNQDIQVWLQKLCTFRLCNEAS